MSSSVGNPVMKERSNLSYVGSPEATVGPDSRNLLRPISTEVPYLWPTGRIEVHAGGRPLREGGGMSAIQGGLRFLDHVNQVPGGESVRYPKRRSNE